jgi:hypothetical protein
MSQGQDDYLKQMIVELDIIFQKQPTLERKLE